MKPINIVLIGIGAFVAYNLAIVAYAYTKEGIFRVTFIAVWAPWLLMNKQVASMILGA